MYLLLCTQARSVYLRPLGSGWRRRCTLWPVPAGSWRQRQGWWQPNEWTTRFLSEGRWRGRQKWHLTLNCFPDCVYLCNHAKRRLSYQSIVQILCTLCWRLSKQTWHRHQSLLELHWAEESRNICFVNWIYKYKNTDTPRPIMTFCHRCQIIPGTPKSL